MLSPIRRADFIEVTTLTREFRVERQFSQCHRWVAYAISSAVPSKHDGVLNTERNRQTPSLFSSLSCPCATINRVMLSHLLASMFSLHVSADLGTFSNLNFITKHAILLA